MRRDAVGGGADHATFVAPGFERRAATNLAGCLANYRRPRARLDGSARSRTLPVRHHRHRWCYVESSAPTLAGRAPGLASRLQSRRTAVASWRLARRCWCACTAMFPKVAEQTQEISSSRLGWPMPPNSHGPIFRTLRAPTRHTLRIPRYSAPPCRRRPHPRCRRRCRAP